MNTVDVGAWNANWAWSLPLIVLNVVIHVVGLGLINESIVHVLSGALSRGRFILMLAPPPLGAAAAEFHHECENRIDLSRIS